MATRKGYPKSLDLDPDLLEVLKRAVTVSYAFEEDKILKLKLLSKAVKKWKKHERIFKE